MAEKKKKIGKARVTSDEFRPITSRTAKGKLKQYNLPTEWMNLSGQAFTDSLQTRYPNQFNLPLSHDDITGQYLQNFARWNKGQPVLNPQTGVANEIPEKGLGGLIGGLLGSLIPIPGLGTLAGGAIGKFLGKTLGKAGSVIGDAIGGGLKNRRQRKLLEGQQGQQTDLLAQQQVQQEEQQLGVRQDAYNTNTFSNKYIPTFAQGGVIGGKLVQLEKNEVTFGPDGNVKKYDLPDHAYATPSSNVDLAFGTKIYSDRLKTSKGVTFAEAADEIKKKVNKINKLYT